MDASSIVTEFMLRTCRQVRKPNKRKLVQLFASSLGDFHQSTQSITVGSVGELYIEPALSCIGDGDWMRQSCRMLAVPSGNPVPRHDLPEYFDDMVEVYEIRDSDGFPGYVSLLLSCQLRRGGGDNNFTVEWVATGEELWLINDIFPDEYKAHGPATTTEGMGNKWKQYGRFHFDCKVSVDVVASVPCLTWPPQASEWPTRRRSCGWPDPATIQSVVSNGCDVVPVAHRRAKDDKWMARHQHRLSFSRAEVALLNSWTPVQQIVYHMLRFFVKTERLSEVTTRYSEKIMSNYYIKTLMLWAAELKPASWWNDNINLVSICRKLLHRLAAWMNNAECKHYFIPQRNLFQWKGDHKKLNHG